MVQLVKDYITMQKTLIDRAHRATRSGGQRMLSVRVGVWSPIGGSLLCAGGTLSGEKESGVMFKKICKGHAPDECDPSSKKHDLVRSEAEVGLLG
jgi:hypothetical protein